MQNTAESIAPPSLFSCRRRYPRIPIAFETLYHSDEQVVVSERGDLSLRSIFVATPSRDLPGTRCILRLRVPGRKALLRIEGVVIRADRRGMAVRFSGMSEEDRRSLAGLLVSLGGLRILPKLDRGGWDAVDVRGPTPAFGRILRPLLH
jgi:hypothetical protein